MMLTMESSRCATDHTRNAGVSVTIRIEQFKVSCDPCGRRSAVRNLRRAGSRIDGRAESPRGHQAIEPSNDRSYCVEQLDETIRTDVTWMRCPPIDEAIEPEPLPDVEPPLAAVVPLEVEPPAPAPVVLEPEPPLAPDAPVEPDPLVDPALPDEPEADPADASVPVTST
jgi:hypothetical protein